VRGKGKNGRRWGATVAGKRELDSGSVRFPTSLRSLPEKKKKNSGAGKSIYWGGGEAKTKQVFGEGQGSKPREDHDLWGGGG